MPIDICPFGECLDLDFDRRYFEIADKGVNNAPLFPGASQKKVDRNDLKYLDIAVIFGIDDTMFNLFNGDIVRQRIERVRRAFRWQKGLELRNFSAFQVNSKPTAAFGLVIIFRSFDLGMAARPAW
ncbi:hypothetical protein [Flavonifractor plautii]|uniref:hypothetical protein n=1 Tax=Flavonifractor plautii TaxID=292800 RepID=UPI003D6D0850